MRQLLQVELTRLRWRRAVFWLLVATIVLPIVIAVTTVLNHSLPDPQQYERAVAQAEKEAARPRHQREIERCIDEPGNYGVVAGDDVEAACRESLKPRPEWFYDSYNTLDLANERRFGSGTGAAVVVALLLILVGTTFVGHDWNTGSMSNQLLFENRRLRIWAAKAVAVTAVGLVVGMVATTLFWLVLALPFATSDSTIPDGVLLDCLQQGWRAGAIGALGSLGGYALTMLTRSTVASLGILFGITVAGTIFFNTVTDDRGWLDPTLNASAVVQNGVTYSVDIPDYCYSGLEVPNGDECRSERSRSLSQGVTYLTILTLVGGAASAASYRRRDVP